MIHDARTRVLLTTILLLGIACQPPTSEVTLPSTRVENQALQIALATLPAPFTVDVNEGSSLRLITSEPDGPGEVEFIVGEISPTGINLVQAVKDRRSSFEQLPEGTYLGNRELGTPIGTAFTARGSYRSDSGEAVEEAWIYALHPVEDRLLNLVYRYAAGGDSGTRVSQLLTVLGEIEALPAPMEVSETATSAAAGDSAEPAVD